MNFNEAFAEPSITKKDYQARQRRIETLKMKIVESIAARTEIPESRYGRFWNFNSSVSASNFGSGTNSSTEQPEDLESWMV